MDILFADTFAQAKEYRVAQPDSCKKEVHGYALEHKESILQRHENGTEPQMRCSYATCCHKLYRVSGRRTCLIVHNYEPSAKSATAGRVVK